jgi:hypothetical protein
MRTLTQRAAMIFGVVFLLVGLMGFFLPGGMGMESHPDHNLVHLGFGVWGLLAARTHSAAKGYHRAGAVIYLVLVVLAFVDPTTFGLVPIGGNDIWLHAVLAAGLGYFGFMHRDAGARV